ncbi:MAG: hypothetical protein J5825_05175 [Lachnospiraceae bacterium]|nr:hypothetical protein [Lachnospiraceae bacterium]
MKEHQIKKNERTGNTGIRRRLSKAATLLLASLTTLTSLTGCNQMTTYEGFAFPEGEASKLKVISDTYVENPISYKDEGTPDKCVAEFESENGACKIRCMEQYYDITLDYENFTPAEIGKAYAETVLKAFPDFHEAIEPYLYENIYSAFPAVEDGFDVVWERTGYLYDTLEDEKWNDYREEIASYAEALSGGVHGFAEDGHISYEEAVTFNFVPEALRGTSCSALSLWGSKTATGDPVTVRFLDWNLGSDYQMCRMHAIIHVKKGERSFTGISFIGFENLVSAINDDGVFAAILDAGSGEHYSKDGRKCYTYDLRYALEEFSTAKEVGDYMVSNSASYTWSHNLIITDKDHSYCAEDAVLQQQEKGAAHSILRDADTPLIKSLSWDSPDSLCVVNSFVSEGNQESLWHNSNAVRWAKYKEWVAAKDSFTLGEIKTMLTAEKVNQGLAKGEAKVDNIRNQGTVQMILVDYHTGTLQVAFTPKTGPTDEVVFTEIGKYCNK